MDGKSENKQEMEKDVCRDKRLRCAVKGLFVLSDQSVVAEQRGSNSVQPATATQRQLSHLCLHMSAYCRS